MSVLLDIDTLTRNIFVWGSYDGPLEVGITISTVNLMGKVTGRTYLRYNGDRDLPSLILKLTKLSRNRSIFIYEREDLRDLLRQIEKCQRERIHSQKASRNMTA